MLISPCCLVSPPPTAIENWRWNQQFEDIINVAKKRFRKNELHLQRRQQFLENVAMFHARRKDEARRV